MAVLARANEDKAGLGIAMMLIAYLFFSVIDTSVKWLLLAGLPAIQLAFMRYFGHFIISLFAVSQGGFSLDNFKTTHVWTVLFRAYLLVSSTLFNFIAINYLSLTVTSAIMFSAPVIVCALSWPLLGERVGPWRWFAIVLGFIGVLIVIRPFGETFHWAALLSMHNAVAMALYSILTRKLAGIVATETMQFYMGALGTFALLIPAAMAWTNPATALDWGLLIGLGVAGWAGHELLTRAHGFAPANTLMPYTYSFMIYLVIASYLIWGEIPDGWTVIGAIVIVLSGLIIWKRAEQRSAASETIAVSKA